MKADKTSKIAVFLLTILITYGFSAVIIPSRAQDEVVLVRMEPTSLTVNEGELFNITVHIDNMPADPGMVGVQFKCSWDPTVLNAVNMDEVMFHNVTPTTDWTNIWMLTHEVTADHVWYSYTWMNMTKAFTNGYAPIYGNHAVATITLNATTIGQTDLDFTVVKIGGYNITTKTTIWLVSYPTGVSTLDYELVESTISVGNPPPIITITSPKNVTYVQTPINLTFRLSEPVEWIGYCLDGQANVTITGNTTIPVLDGSHNLKVYANDTDGNMGVSETYFNYDFAGVRGDPHKAFRIGASTELVPTSAGWTELNSTQYEKIWKSENDRASYSSNVSGEYALMLFRFKVNFGVPTKIALAFEGYGNASAGTGVTIKVWNDVAGAWQHAQGGVGATDETLTITLTSDLSDYVDDNSYVWLLARTTNPSDGTTAAAIYTDYCRCTVTVKEVYFYVDATPPEASFTYSPAELKAEMIFGSYKWNITFDASASSDNATGIVSYTWDFGDGSTGQGVTVTHLFRNAGTYDVTLTVKDGANHIDTETATLTLTEPTPSMVVPWWIIIFIAVLVVWGAVIGVYWLRTKRKA